MRRGHFLKVQADNRKIVTNCFVFLLRPNEVEHARLGLIVSKKVGCAVVRNRIKRVCREAFRLLQPFEGEGMDIVVIPRRQLPRPAPFHLVAKEFETMVRRFAHQRRKREMQA